MKMGKMKIDVKHGKGLTWNAMKIKMKLGAIIIVMSTKTLTKKCKLLITVYCQVSFKYIHSSETVLQRVAINGHDMCRGFVTGFS